MTTQKHCNKKREVAVSKARIRKKKVMVVGKNEKEVLVLK